MSDQQIRIPADVVADPEIVGDPAHEYATSRRRQFAAIAGWHLRWKYQQVHAIVIAVFEAIDSTALAVIRLVYALGSYGFVSTMMWNWFGAPLKAHHSPTFQTFVAAAMVVAMLAMLVNATHSIFSEWNWHDKAETPTRPSRHTGDNHKDAALDHLHAQIVTAGYQAFFYGFPWIVLALAWVLTLL